LREGDGNRLSVALGLKENIIIGHLIPAGSGIYRYAEIDIQPSAGCEAPPPRVEEPAAAGAGGGAGGGRGVGVAQESVTLSAREGAEARMWLQPFSR
jgi:hypothetical protein